MSNMSYCRFQNTLNDLKDCCNHMEDDELSESEKTAREEILEISANLIDEYGCEIGLGLVEID